MKTETKQQLLMAYEKDANLRANRDGEARTGWKKDELDQFISRLHTDNLESILELGAGVGIDSAEFTKAGFDVLATDFSPNMVEVCREKGINSMVLDLYDINKLDKSFDAVYSMNVLLHVDPRELDAVLLSIAERLNKSGLFYYGVYGGKDLEKTINDKTRMGEDRYFSFLANETILKYVSPYFEVVDFHTIDLPSEENKWFLYQSLTLRKK